MIFGSFSDECYDAITFDVPHISPAAYDEQHRVISCFSFSKTYAMTGLRVGYLVAPEEVAATAAKMQEPLIACVNAPAQYAALAEHVAVAPGTTFGPMGQGWARVSWPPSRMISWRACDASPSSNGAGQAADASGALLRSP